MSAPEVTWWGCASVAISGETTLVVDPYVALPPQPVSVICVTHADDDHCHEPTLRRLIAQPAFEVLIAPDGCRRMSELDVPHGPDPADLAFVPDERLAVLYPGLTRSGTHYPEPHSVEQDEFLIETIESSERPERYKPADGTRWPAMTGAFAGDDFPTLGYVITHKPSGLVFFHPGDLTEAFDAQRSLRGHVDVMFFPGIKLHGIELTVVDNVRPRYLVPIHHRDPDADFPVPLTVTNDDLRTTTVETRYPEPGSEQADFRLDIQRLQAGHWYPTPVPPHARFDSLAPAFRQLGAEPMTLRAGATWRIDDDE